jgi:hypothetical protein
MEPPMQNASSTKEQHPQPHKFLFFMPGRVFSCMGLVIPDLTGVHRFHEYLLSFLPKVQLSPVIRLILISVFVNKNPVSSRPPSRPSPCRSALGDPGLSISNSISGHNGSLDPSPVRHSPAGEGGDNAFYTIYHLQNTIYILNPTSRNFPPHQT